MTEVSVVEERLTVRNSRGDRLAACWHLPAATNGRGVVVVSHGMLSSKDSDKHREVCSRVASAGWFAVRFDFAGRGESEGDPELLTVSREIDDLGCVLEVVRKRHGRSAPLVLAGSSLGGTVAVLTAASMQPAGLVTAGAPAKIPQQARSGWTGSGALENGRVQVAPGEWIRSEFFSDAARHDVPAAARQVSCPWLVIHATNDDVVSFSNASSLASAGRATRLLAHPSAGHRFHEPAHQRWLVGQVAAFVQTISG